MTANNINSSLVINHTIRLLHTSLNKAASAVNDDKLLDVHPLVDDKWFAVLENRRKGHTQYLHIHRTLGNSPTEDTSP
ncbi:hypothetical protein J6590_002897 [Homalodisca vitripennis]|nr:hypothetical protein J6590_002897 [Homalodisca vitripennis]